MLREYEGHLHLSGSCSIAFPLAMHRVTQGGRPENSPPGLQQKVFLLLGEKKENFSLAFCADAYLGYSWFVCVALLALYIQENKYMFLNSSYIPHLQFVNKTPLDIYMYKSEDHQNGFL